LSSSHVVKTAEG